jgi:hypothetical protein
MTGILVGATVFQGAYPKVGDRLANADQFDVYALRTPFALAKQKVFYTEGQWPASTSSPQPVGELAGAGIHLIISLKPGRDPTGSYTIGTQVSTAPSGATIAQEKASLAAALSLLSGIAGITYEVVLWNEPQIASNGVFPFTTPASYQAYVNYYGPTVTGAGVPLCYIVGMSQPATAVSFFATGLGFAKIYADYYCNVYTGSQHVTLDAIETLADANTLPFGVAEWGRTGSASSVPSVAQFTAWADTQIWARFTARLSAGKPTADVIWWGATPSPNIINASTSPDIIAELDKIYDALTAPTPPPPPPPPPPGPPPAPGITSVTTGPLSGLDAVLAASNPAQGSAWPTGATRQYVGLSPGTGTALMPNPEIIPATLQLQGTPPLVIPGGQAGQVLTSDGAGNITLAAGSTLDTTASDIKSDGVQSAGTLTVGSAADHIHPYQSNLSMYVAPAVATAETFPRALALASVSLAGQTGVLQVMQIGLPKGLAISNLAFVTKGTAAAGQTHGWFVLLDNALVVRAVTADQTTAGTGGLFGSTGQAYVLPTNAYTTTYGGYYYIGVMVAATTMPALVTSGTLASTGIASLSPLLCATSSSGQTTPPATLATVGALTVAAANTFYAYTA